MHENVVVYSRWSYTAGGRVQQVVIHSRWSYTAGGRIQQVVIPYDGCSKQGLLYVLSCLILLPVSLMKILKSVGDSTDRCGIPFLMSVLVVGVRLL